MVTYSDLFEFCILMVTVIGLAGFTTPSITYICK